MKKKKLIWFAFIAFVFAVCLAGCKGCKKEPPPPPPPVTNVDKISEQEFVKSLRNEIAGLKEGEPLNKKIDTAVVETKESWVKMERLKAEWEYSELQPVIEQLLLTVVWVGPESGSRLKVLNYKDFLDYIPGDKFLVLETPVKVTVGENVYYVNSSGEFWKPRS